MQASTASPEPFGPWLTYEQLSRYTGHSLGSLYVFRSRNPKQFPPGYGSGKSTRFRVAEVDHWLTTRTTALPPKKKARR